MGTSLQVQQQIHKILFVSCWLRKASMNTLVYVFFGLFFFLILLSAEQPWAEDYIQHGPHVLESYPAPEEIHPQPMEEKPSQYEGIRQENSTPSLKHSIGNHLTVVLCGLLDSKSSTGHASTCAAWHPWPGDLHPLQKKRNAEDHREGAASSAPLPQRGPWTRSPPSHLFPTDWWSAGSQAGRWWCVDYPAAGICHL